MDNRQIVGKQLGDYFTQLETSPAGVYILCWSGVEGFEEDFLVHAVQFMQETDQWSDPFYDDLIESARLETDQKQIVDLLREAEKYLVEDLVIIVPLIHTLNQP